MSTLFVGDVHGCARELDQLVQKVGPSRVVLVGDLFTKGPDPVGVWNQIRAGGYEAVLGNHDDRLLGVLAGRRPHDRHGAKVVAALDAADPGWRSWLLGLPLTLDREGVRVVHAGLHPSGDVTRTTRRQALVMRRWPWDRPNDVRWHQVYVGALPVVFGHDAVQGLVRRERAGAPYVVGLDSGCVYGGSLSGWTPQADVVTSVSAAEAYCPT